MGRLANLAPALEADVTGMADQPKSQHLSRPSGQHNDGGVSSRHLDRDYLSLQECRRDWICALASRGCWPPWKLDVTFQTVIVGRERISKSPAREAAKSSNIKPPPPLYLAPRCDPDSHPLPDAGW
jgi:hypothetical protein